MADPKDKNKNPAASASSAGHDSSDQGDGAHDDGHGHGGHGSELTDVIELGSRGDGLSKIALGVGVGGLVVSVVLGGGVFGLVFQRAYLAAFMWGLSISVGALAWVTIQHLMAARASIVMRRLGEVVAQGVMIMALLALPLLVPVLMHNPVLYSWLDHEVVEKFHLHSKEPWLSSGTFAIRVAIYFGFFIFFARFLLETSIKQQAPGQGQALAAKLQARSAPGMIAFAILLTFCSIDFLMTLDPIWFSTIFGVYYFSTAILTFCSVLMLGIIWLQSRGVLSSAITAEHRHDVGKFMFGFIIFWTYIGFSQFMLIWYANIPEETHWFHDRLEGSWKPATLVLAALHFAIPFFGLMSREVKRNKKAMVFWSLWVLAVCWFDMYWLVAPNFLKDGVSIGVVDITTLLGVGGVLLWFVLWRAKEVSLLASGAPRLDQSLAFENI